MSPGETPLEDPLASSEVGSLLEAAAWAPSGDNTQPWQLRFDSAGRVVEILLDPARDASPMNAGQQMAFIACGAAAENVSLRARELGLAAAVEWLPASRLAGPTVVARVVLSGRGAAEGSGSTASVQGFSRGGW